MVLMLDMLQALAHAVHQDRDAYAFQDTWEPAEWETFLALARFHGLTPLLGHALESKRITGVPPAIAKDLQKDLHKNRIFHVNASKRLDEIETVFKQKDISMVPLKGPRLSDLAYESTGLRPFEDLDLLIEPHHTERASTALNSLGYEPFKGQANTRRMKLYHFHNQWSHPQTRQCVELHWRPADSRALPIDAKGEETFFTAPLRDDPAAYAVYLAVHLNKHGIVSDALRIGNVSSLFALHPYCDTRLIWFIDYVRFMKKEGLSDTDVLAYADRWQVKSAVENTEYLISVIKGPELTVPQLHAELNLQKVTGWQRRVIGTIQKELHGPAVFPQTPWWLKPGKRTGFRPVRLLDVIKG